MKSAVKIIKLDEQRKERHFMYGLFDSYEIHICETVHGTSWPVAVLRREAD